MRNSVHSDRWPVDVQVASVGSSEAMFLLISHQRHESWMHSLVHLCLSTPAPVLTHGHWVGNSQRNLQVLAQCVSLLLWNFILVSKVMAPINNVQSDYILYDKF